MPVASINGHACFYRIDGADDAPVLILAHSLGQDHAMWDDLTADAARHFTVVRYDLRGHGASGVPASECSIEQLGQDVLALADRLGVGRLAFCGISIGGMVGQWLGVHTHRRLTHLVLANTSPRPDAQAMEARRRAVLQDGIAAIEDAAVGRFFSPGFASANPIRVATARRTLRATNPAGYASCAAAVRDMDMRGALNGILVPTLVIGGNLDVSMPWAAHGTLLADAIPDNRVVHLQAAHLSNLEAPRSFSAAVLGFLLPAVEDSLAAGFTVRRSILGDAHVDRAVAATTEFTREFQQLITRYVWGTIWTRPGLDPRTRRLLVIAIMAANGRWEEFRLHVRTGLMHGLESCDLEEVLLQVAIYAGVPAANTAFHFASEEMARVGADPPPALPIPRT